MADARSTDEQATKRVEPPAGAWDAYYEAYSEFRDNVEGWKAFFTDHHTFALGKAMEGYVPAAELESVRAERDALAARVDMAAWDELTAERDGYESEASDERERADRLAATIARVKAALDEMDVEHQRLLAKGAFQEGTPHLVNPAWIRAALAGPGDRNFSELTGHPFICPGHPAIAEPFFCTVCGTGATHIQNGTCRDCGTDPVRRRIQALDTDGEAT